MLTATGCSTDRNLSRGLGAQRLVKLEDECRQRIDEANEEVELRPAIGQLEEFAKRVSQELQEPDWDTRRNLVGPWRRSRGRRAGGPHRVSGLSTPF